MCFILIICSIISFKEFPSILIFFSFKLYLFISYDKATVRLEFLNKCQDNTTYNVYTCTTNSNPNNLYQR